MILTTPALINRLFQTLESGYSLLPANRAAESLPFLQPLYKNSTYSRQALLQKKKKRNRRCIYIG